MKSRPMGPNEPILASQGNDRRDDARAGSFLLPHQMFGTLALGTTPTNGQTVTFVINGTSVVFKAVTGTPTNPGDVKAPGTALGFVTNIVNALRRPELSTATYVPVSSANQSLLEYLGWAWPGSSTSIVPFSVDKNTNGNTDKVTSFNITTTITSGSWTAQTLKLYVQDGTYYVNGTRYLFTGGITPTVTAPSSYPRIDVLTIDTSGTLAWTTGTENASPVAPAYPANKVPICELYNVVSETALYDNENQQSGQGYISNDVRATITYGPVFSAIAENLVPSAADTYNLGSSGNEWLNVYAQNIVASSSITQNGSPIAAAKFGGTSADGALTITSGTTTLSFASAQVLVKNYSSISITGTGALTTSNPNSAGSCLILKCSGNCTVTSSSTAAIYVDGMGAVGGTGATSSLGQPGNGGNAQIGWYKANGATSTGYNSTAGTATMPGAVVLYTVSPYLSKWFQYVFCGGGGIGAYYDGGSGTSASGGRGGGALVIEIAGSLNFGASATISAQGLAGGADTIGTTQTIGGGGGGGGSITIFYNLLTANSGTTNVSGGANTTGTGTGATKQAGSGGASPYSAGSGGNGTFGGSGVVTIQLNTEFS